MEQSNILIEVGTKVILEPTGNLARRSHPEHFLVGEVVSIGRKYFYVSRFPDNPNSPREKFEIATLKNINADCNSAYVLWDSEENFRHHIEHDKMLEEIRSYFRNYGCGNSRPPLDFDTCHSIYQTLLNAGFVSPVE